MNKNQILERLQVKFAAYQGHYEYIDLNNNLTGLANDPINETHYLAELNGLFNHFGAGTQELTNVRLECLELLKAYQSAKDDAEIFTNNEPPVSTVTTIEPTIEETIKSAATGNDPQTGIIVTLTEKDLINNPTMVADGLNVGDKIELGPIMTKEEVDEYLKKEDVNLNDGEQTPEGENLNDIEQVNTEITDKSLNTDKSTDSNTEEKHIAENNTDESTEKAASKETTTEEKHIAENNTDESTEKAASKETTPAAQAETTSSTTDEVKTKKTGKGKGKGGE